MPENIPSIPSQQEGASSNTETHKDLQDRKAAEQLYARAADRLLHVNRWHELAGAGTAAFQLTDAQGTPVDRAAQVGDHFKIDIPGPGPATGDGYDWVRIESITPLDEGMRKTLTMRVRPATNPNNDKKDVAHFFADSATSNFTVMLEGNRVTAGVYGRNEKPNAAAESLLDKARNIAVASGAVAGAAKLQWKSLVNGLLSE